MTKEKKGAAQILVCIDHDTVELHMEPSKERHTRQ